MRNIAQARVCIVRQLCRRDIADKEQRACLNGMLSALNWVDGTGGKALQNLIEGRPIIAKLEGTPGPPKALSFSR